MKLNCANKMIFFIITKGFFQVILNETTAGSLFHQKNKTNQKKPSANKNMTVSQKASF